VVFQVVGITLASPTPPTPPPPPCTGGTGAGRPRIRRTPSSSIGLNRVPVPLQKLQPLLEHVKREHQLEPLDHVLIVLAPMYNIGQDHKAEKIAKLL